MGLCGDAPDTSGMNAAAEANAEVAKEALAFYKQVYAEQQPHVKRAAETAIDVSNQQLASMRQNDAIAQDYYDYQKGTYRPLEQGIVEAANNYDSAQRQEANAARAISDVGQQSEIARQSMNRNLARRGVTPSSGKMLALNSELGLREALNKATAANKARDATETQGWARKMDAASLGRNLASNQATSAGIALNAGNSAVGNAQAPVGAMAQSASTMGQGFSTAISGNNSAGSLYAQAAKLSGEDNGVWGALGNVAGSYLGSESGSSLLSKGIMAMSDKKAKKNIKPQSPEQALDAVEKTPVSSWNYKQGRGDGGSHIGPMAQHVQQTMGEQAAPGGKAVDLITMNGVNMAATQALAKRVEKLEKGKGKRK